MIWDLFWIALNTAILLGSRHYLKGGHAAYEEAKEIHEEARQYANQAREAYRRSNSYYDHASKLYAKIKEEMER